MITKSVDPFRGNDVLEPPGDRVYPIPLTPFPFDPPPKKHVFFAKSHVLFGANHLEKRFLATPAGSACPVWVHLMGSRQSPRDIAIFTMDCLA